MVVGGDLQQGDRLCRCAAFLPHLPISQPWTSAPMHRRAPLQIREARGSSPIASVGGADQREEGRVLGDGKQLPIAERPTPGGEVTGEYLDLCDEGFRHVRPP